MRSQDLGNRGPASTLETIRPIFEGHLGRKQKEDVWQVDIETGAKPKAHVVVFLLALSLPIAPVDASIEC